MALGRGRKANQLYLTRTDRTEPCDHVAHTDQTLQPNDGSGILGRSRVHTAAFDHQTPEQSINESELGLLHSPPTNNRAERVRRIIAQSAYSRGNSNNGGEKGDRPLDSERHHSAWRSQVIIATLRRASVMVSSIREFVEASS